MKYFDDEQPMELYYTTDTDDYSYSLEQFNEFREQTNPPTDFTFEDYKKWKFVRSLHAFNDATSKYLPVVRPIIAFVGVYGCDMIRGVGLFDGNALPEAIFSTAIKTMDNPEDLTSSDVTVYINNGNLFADFQRKNRTDMVMFRRVAKGIDATELCQMYGRNEITDDDLYNYTESMEEPISKAFERMIYELGE